MTMLFTGNLHAEGWWDHMPPGHRVDIIMNPEAVLPSRHETAPGAPLRAGTPPNPLFMSEPMRQTGPTVRTPLRRIKRSHASVWIMLAAVGATGAALAVATLRDPQSMRERLDSTLDEVKSLASSSPRSTPTTEPTPAPIDTPAPPPFQEPGPVTTVAATAPSQSRSADEPLPRTPPAAGRDVSSPVPGATIKHHAPPAPRMTEYLADTQPLVPNLPSPTPRVPVQPLSAVEAPPPVQAPPAVLAPLTVQPPAELAPPPVQAPASSAQR